MELYSLETSWDIDHDEWSQQRCKTNIREAFSKKENVGVFVVGNPA
jgi:hypothetical protein